MTTTDAPRMELAALVPPVYKALLALDKATSTALDPGLRELVRIRASQVNGCVYCIDSHTRDARAGGETEQRIYLLSAWRESAGFFTERERAALALTEAVTVLTDGHVPDEVYERAAKHFPDPELAELIGLIIMINAWNRVGVTTRLVVGS